MNGTVKWFNSTKSFGFIAPDDNSGEVFIHTTQLPVDPRFPKQGMVKDIAAGRKVSFEVTMDRGKRAAANVKLLL